MNPLSYTNTIFIYIYIYINIYFMNFLLLACAGSTGGLSDETLRFRFRLFATSVNSSISLVIFIIY